MEELFNSLQRLARLPDDTPVYCAHEYTQANIRFALACEPGNERLRQREADTRTLRAADRPTLPSTIALEKATNPFLRFHDPDMTAFASHYLNRPHPAPAEVFGAIRAAKDAWDN